MSASGPEKGTRPASGNPVVELVRATYHLLSDTSFAIIIVLVLALTSILAMVVVDQLPIRGELARVRLGDRMDEPWIWFLVNVVPDHPYRSPLFRTLLALLSLSLLACIVKRWSHQWRQAFSNRLPAEDRFDSSRVVSWSSQQALPMEKAVSFFRGKWFHVKAQESGDSFRLAASRFGFARMGPILTHLGFLFLVVGGLIMASSGTSSMVWLRPGDWVRIPGTDAHIELLDFTIEMTSRGQIADYVSHVRLVRDTTVVREMHLEVNKPLRHAGYSFYQSSYRPDPFAIPSLQLVYDVPVEPSIGDRSTTGETSEEAAGEAPGAGQGGEPEAPGRAESGQGRAGDQPGEGSGMGPGKGPDMGSGERPGEHPSDAPTEAELEERLRELLPEGMDPSSVPPPMRRALLAEAGLSDRVLGAGDTEGAMGGTMGDAMGSAMGGAMGGAESAGGPHGQHSHRFVNPVTFTLRKGERIEFPRTPYAAEIDTFFTDFRVGEHGPAQGSNEPRNPAVLLRLYEDQDVIGHSWYFLFHPDMVIGTGPELPLRFVSYDPVMQSGLEMATHPGSEWVWVGLAVMTLGTLVAFLIRHERVLLRARRADGAWKVDWIHIGAGNQEPALVDHAWQASITSLTAKFLEQWPPAAGKPDRYPKPKTTNA